ncbi:MAG: hypothetical protein KAT05_17855, partial [Spirochaetes bacterium]|nr:hypothetical protein [Spirochaetota bacterium]
EMYSYSQNGNSIVLLGTIIDPVNYISDSNLIIKKLLEKYIQSENDFFDYLDLLSGRFILVIQSSQKTIALHDATGIKTLFYHKLSEEIILSSHIQMIAEIKKYKIRGLRLDYIKSSSFKTQSRYLPGISTTYENINILSPNTLIDLSNRKIKRFFPREKLNRQKISPELVDELAILLSNQVDLLSKKYKLAISLTGGIDSRLTLAAARKNIDDIVCFTYVFNDDLGHKEDLKFAEDMCKKNNINHQIYLIDKNKYNKPVDTFRRNSAFIRADSQGIIAKALMDRYPGGRLHLKSTVSEIGEGFLLRHYPPLPAFKIILPYLFSYFFNIRRFSKFSLDSFKEYIDITSFCDIFNYNYLYYDMLYWEHRNGCWQSLQIQDFDVSHDTFIIYNNRHILKKLLSVNIIDRLECNLQFQLIKKLWPELLDVPINSWKPKTKRQIITKAIWKFFK